MQLVLAPQFAYVIFTFIASIFTLLYLGSRVMNARKKYGVDYPHMYDNTKPLFNCAQRGHQNFLETYPYFLVLLFIAGVENPTVAAVAGLIHLAGRVVYAISYECGDPSKRNRAAIFIYPSLLTLLGLTGYFAYKLLLSQ